MNAAISTAATARPRAALGPFLAWVAVGAGACLAVLSVLSTGIFVLPVVATGTIVLHSSLTTRRSGRFRSGATPATSVMMV